MPSTAVENRSGSLPAIPVRTHRLLSALILTALLPAAHAGVYTYTSAAAYATAANWTESLITFEDLPLNTNVSNQYSALGISFYSGDWGAALPKVVSSLTELSQSFPMDAKAARTYRKGTANPYTYGMRVSFADPMRSFGGYHIDVGTSLLVSLYDPLGGTLGSFSFAGGGESGNTATFFGLISDSRDMGYAELYTTSNFPGDLVAFDNLRFGAGPIPEPSTTALLLAGIAALALRRRRARTP